MTSQPPADDRSDLTAWVRSIVVSIDSRAAALHGVADALRTGPIAAFHPVRMMPHRGRVGCIAGHDIDARSGHRASPASRFADRPGGTGPCGAQ
jgi:hypothetical protein